MAGDVEANWRREEEERGCVASLKALLPSSGRFAKKDIFGVTDAKEGFWFWVWVLAACAVADNAAG
jgi:hypothetical protein